MYRVIPIESLMANPLNSNRISKSYEKKLSRNLEQTSYYETLTVRPHPSKKNSFEILNGHVRLTALKRLGVSDVKCDVWDVDDRQSHLFLAILNKLRGSEVSELRMDLLFNLLNKYTAEELSEQIPESTRYLERLKRLPEEIEKIPEEKEKPDVVILTFHLSHEEHRIVSDAIERIMEAYHLPDSGKALVKMAQMCLASL